MNGIAYISSVMTMEASGGHKYNTAFKTEVLHLANKSRSTEAATHELGISRSRLD
jgi:hypothetical protein